MPGAFTVPVAAFKFEHDGPRVDRPPPTFGQHNDEVLAELGYSKAEIEGFRAALIAWDSIDGYSRTRSRGVSDAGPCHPRPGRE